MSIERQSLINGLREFATFLENTPDAPTPLVDTRFDVFLTSKEELVNAQKAIGGKFEKRAITDYFWLRKEFGPISYDLNVARSTICDKVVVGTRVVPEIPAVPEHVEEVIEWKCGEVLR
jgi:hypothetical protein